MGWPSRAGLSIAIDHKCKGLKGRLLQSRITYTVALSVTR